MAINSIDSIDGSATQAMLEQLRAGSRKRILLQEIVTYSSALGSKPAVKIDFAQTLEKTLQAVSDRSAEARELGQRLTLGDNSISLADTMIAMQKSSIAFQGTLQVRNQVVTAYTNIMNMQV